MSKPAEQQLPHLCVTSPDPPTSGPKSDPSKANATDGLAPNANSGLARALPFVMRWLTAKETIALARCSKWLMNFVATARECVPFEVKLEPGSVVPPLTGMLCRMPLSVEWTSASNSFDEADVERLLTLARFGRVARLICRSAISDADAKRLFADPGMQQLVELRFESSSALILQLTARLPMLQTLDTGKQALDPAAYLPLLHSRSLTSLRVTDAPSPSAQGMTAANRAAVMSALTSFIAQGGAGAYIGEDVTILHHLLQVSDRAAQEMGTVEARVAGFLHDIGHLFPDAPDIFGELQGQRVAVGKQDHEETGAEQIKRWGFPPEIYEPVRLHVQSKRYLVAAARRQGAVYVLSPASEQSLKCQGGPMSAAEMEAFESNPYHSTALALRRAEEMGKEPGARTSELDEVIEVTRAYLEWCSAPGCLPVVCRMNRLRVLEVSQPQLNAHTFVSFCAAIPHLQQLTLDKWSSSDMQSVSAKELATGFASLRCLRALRFTSCIPTEEVLGQLHLAPALRCLSLDSATVSEESIASLARRAPMLHVARV